jgi:acyl-CoA dehydrogenase
MQGLVPPVVRLDARAHKVRAAVRDFLREELRHTAFVPSSDAWLSGWDEAFSRRLGECGWIGMTIPAEYGGGGRTALERYVVIEELLAAGAPVAAHWIADRQTAPSLLTYGNEHLKRRYLPGIARGETYFGIGLSEPDAGSDLAAVRTRATRTDGGWIVNGQKVWTSGAHHAHAFIVLLRTAPTEPSRRHQGLSQFVIEFDQPGISVRPIISMTGEHHFNEVVLEEVFVGDSMVLGTVGAGWEQATSELAYERSGPERFLSTFPLLTMLIEHLSGPASPGREADERIGSLVSRLWACRQMSLAVAGALQAGQNPEIAAALTKDVGTRLEAEIVAAVRALAGVEPGPGVAGLSGALAHAILHAPGFTLRGGTSEILRGVVARALGVR